MTHPPFTSRCGDSRRASAGSVVETAGLTAAVAGLPAPVGAIVAIGRPAGGEVEAEVIGFRGDHTLVIPLANLEGVRRGSPVRLVSTARTLRVGPELLGRVVDARGRVIDGRPQPALDRARAAGRRRRRRPPSGPRIDRPLGTGVRAIDGMLTCGRGQRLGIFAGSGVGKSVLMGMMARYTAADVAVIALIGERGREVNEFIERELGPDGLGVAAWSSWPRATSRRCFACGRPTRRRPLPNISATPAQTCCWSWTR